MMFPVYENTMNEAPRLCGVCETKEEADKIVNSRNSQRLQFADIIKFLRTITPDTLDNNSSPYCTINMYKHNNEYMEILDAKGSTIFFAPVYSKEDACKKIQQCIVTLQDVRLLSTWYEVGEPVEMLHYESPADKVAKFLHDNNLCGMQAFSSRNCVGDEMENLFSFEAITVDICYGYDYLEILGLTTEEFKQVCKECNLLGGRK